jgi:uncharacterized protein
MSGDPRPTTDNPPPGDSSSQPTRRKALQEVLLVFGLATLVCAVLWQLRGIPFLGHNLHAFIAAIFLYLPTFLLMRRQEDFAAYGLTSAPVKRGVLVFLLGAGLVFPLFTLGFYGYYQLTCSAARSGYRLPLQLRMLCGRFVGSWRLIHWRWPKDFGQLALAQLLVVALPEEYFFRGYVQTRLGLVWPGKTSQRRFRLSWDLLATSALFALGHFLVDFNPLRLAVFFPSLVFGLMRQVTGSILAGVLFHACSNLISELLHGLFF